MSTEQLPYSSTLFCKAPEDHEVIISLDIKNQLSFHVTSSEIQVASIRQVALQHGIRFTPAQLTELKTIFFLRTDVENLPHFLSLPTYQRNRLAELKKIGPLSEKELVECIVAARASAASLIQRTIYTSLKIDSEVKAPHIERLLDLLQAQGIHQFNIKTQFP